MTDFCGLPVLTLRSNHLEVDVLRTAGPRIVRLRMAGSAENLLGEAPDTHWSTPLGDFHVYGGHRLCAAPENQPYSQMPDASGLELTELEGGVRLELPSSEGNPLRREMTVRLEADHAGLVIEHRLVNESREMVECAPWGITVLPLGGKGILPWRDTSRRTGSVLPDRHLSLWEYSSLRDERLQVADDFIVVQGLSAMPPCKVGIFTPLGWGAYTRENFTLIKRFDVHAGMKHPDDGCNAEIYCNDKFLELESLAPLSNLQPGESASHTERWEIVPAGHSVV